MNRKYYLYVITPLLVLSVALHFFCSVPHRVERIYSGRVYPIISRLLRSVFSFSPISVGDLLYGALVLLLMIGLFQFLKKLFSGRLNRRYWVVRFKWLLPGLLSVYLLFNGLWGVNYNRTGVAVQLALDTARISKEELVFLDSILLEKVKATVSRSDFSAAWKAEVIFAEATAAYRLAASRYSFLENDSPLVRSSLWGWLGDYAGFMGYYNPFTGEAQVNTRIPRFLIPYTTCHEIAHQLGYAKENEANFAGYLAASSSRDIRFRYSAYLDLFLYANADLFKNDSVLAKKRAALLPDQAKQDIAEWRRYAVRQHNVLADVVDRVYALYLRRNRQPSGLKTYSEVTRLLIGYYRKTGNI